ncbi:aspartate dehydrogenase domain-containing protein [Leucobacter sp. HNU]|uniref:aspartate dehydrogenase domain-containing protein n=1 Tax=Leucobacter sp. HNU TaxID=3236805 RepID=UPI003A7FACAC
MAQQSPLRVTLLGLGAIGARVTDGLRTGAAPGAVLIGAVVRTPGTATARGITELDLDDAVASSDLVVECAGVPAARELGPRVVSAGRDLLLVSIGALADPLDRARLLDGPGVCRLSTGAIGGLDLLRAATRDGGITRAALTTTKRPEALVQPWMTGTERAALLGVDAPTRILTGSVRDAIERFPGSLNVAVALAAATGLWEETEVRLVADPGAPRTEHAIEASGPAGEYRFTAANAPLPERPASSGIVSQAVLRGIADLARPGGAFI